MELTYKYSESSVKPRSIEVCKKTVYLRKSFSEIELFDVEGSSVTGWGYEEAKIPREEFEKNPALYIALNDMEKTDPDQLIIMEAIADLYDLIADISSGGVK